ncbi:MAG: hypothetical protein LC799_09910 [Actinobacteria bacterium]|nr:hypothetical protein [Actinomycetota bacterium]
MTALRAQVGDYLVVRRALGYKLARTEKLLGQFVAHCESVGATTVTTEVAVAWAQLPAEESSWWWAQRLGVVRAFAPGCRRRTRRPKSRRRMCSGPCAPSAPFPTSTPTPEVDALMDATARLRYPLHRATYRALVGLLAITACGSARPSPWAVATSPDELCPTRRIPVSW